MVGGLQMGTGGVVTQGTLSGGSKKSNERTEGVGEIRFTSPITQQDIDGKIWWDYGIGDNRYQEEGCTIPDNVLPTVHFEFDGKSFPKYMDIVITSYWSKISPTRSQPNRTQIHKLLRLFKSIGKTQCISFSNLLQIVALTANMDNLMKRNRYKAKVKMHLDSGISEPPEPEGQRLEAESLKGIDGTPAVVQVVDADNLIQENHYHPAKVKMNLDSGIHEPPMPEDQRPEAESLKGLGIEGKSVVVDADRTYIVTLLTWI